MQPGTLAQRVSNSATQAPAINAAPIAESGLNVIEISSGIFVKLSAEYFAEIAKLHNANSRGRHLNAARVTIFEANF